MPAKTEANSGFRYGWDSGESGWGSQRSNDINALGQAGVHLQIKDRHLTAPPGSPTDGDRYIPAATATGGWATHEGKIAVWDGQLTIPAWVFFTPKEGWSCYVDDEDIRIDYDGSNWRPVAGAAAAPASSSGTLVLDLLTANVFNVTLTEAVTTLTLSNPKASGQYDQFTLISAQDGIGGFSYTWPASVDWPGGTAPTQTTAANAVDIYHFMTVDGGTTWHGRQLSADSK